MSRKKYPINENSLGGRLRLFREGKIINIVMFSELLEMSQGSLSDIENNKTKPSAGVVDALVRNTDINIYWLFTGEGEMFRKESDNTNIYKEENENPGISELIKMTREILKSDTDYALNLSANIKSFYKSVQLENEVHALKNRVSKIEGKLSASADKIRKEDPPEGKTKL